MTTHEITINLQNPTDGMHFHADTGDGHTIMLDSDESVGGRNLGVRPQKLVLVSLASCSGMDVLSILRKKRQLITGLHVQVTGERAESYPKVYTGITVTYEITGRDVDPAAVERSIELSMTKYCPVAAMLQQIVPIETRYTITEADADTS